MSTPRRVRRDFSRLRPVSELNDGSGGSGMVQRRRMVLAGVRESAEYDYAPIEDMMQKVLEDLVDRFPDLQPILDVGAGLLKPGLEGDRLRSQFKVEALYARGGRRKRPTAYAVQRTGIRVLLGLVSAGKATVDGGSENAWLSVMEEQVRRYEPAEFVTGQFSRVLRNKDLAGGLKTAFKASNTVIKCFEWPNGFSMGQADGDMAWDLLAQAATWDWTANLTRLQMGSLHQLKQGRYPRSEGSLPPGYIRVTEADGRYRVIPDPSKKEMIRTLVEVAARPLAPAAAVKVLADAGFTTRRAGEPARRLDEVKEPAVALRHLLQHLETYLTGRYTYWQRNTLPGCTSMLGVEVRKEKHTDMGYFEFDLEFGLPEGGWHEAAMIERAIAQRDKLHPKSGKSTDSRKPLLGLTAFRRDGYEYRLVADDRAYVLRRRPSDSDATLSTAFDTLEGEIVGRFAAEHLHRTVAQLMQQATRLVPTDLPVVHDPVRQLELADDLALRAEEAEKCAANARAEVALWAKADPDLADGFRADASRALREARALRAEESSRRESLNGIRAGAELTIDSTRVQAVAELLSRTANLAPPHTCQAVRQVVEDLRIDSTSGDPAAELKLSLRLSSSEGLITVGPLAALLRNTAGKRRARDGVAERTVRLIHAFYSEDVDSGLAAREGLINRAEKRRLTAGLAELLPHPKAAPVLVDTPISDIRVAVLTPLMNTYGLSALPGYDDLDQSWAEEMHSVYLGDAWGWQHPTWATRNFTKQRQLLGWIERHGGSDGVDISVLKARLQVGDPELYVLLSEDPAKYRSSRAGDWAPLEYVHPHTKHASSEDGKQRLVRLRACPHCSARNAGHLLRVPELSQGWICAECHRAPGSNIVFPDRYLQPWAGSQSGTKQVRTDEQVATIIKSGTRMLPFTIPPYAGKSPR